MSYIFAYREKDYNRDSCCYIDDSRIGTQNVHGPCFSKGFGNNFFNGGTVSYDEVETYLTEEEYYDACENGISQELVEILTSPEAQSFAEDIFADEYQAMKDEFDLSNSDLDSILDTYYLDYRDRGIIGYVEDSWDSLARNEAWNLGMVNDPNERYFDFASFAEDLQQEDRYLELDNGRVVILNY